MEENNTMVAAENVANEVAVNSVSNGKKSGLVISIVSVSVLGAAFGTYKLIKFFRKKKTAKKAAKTEVAE